MSARSGLERQFAELRDALRQYGQSRYPLLHGELDDVVAESLANLWEYLKRRYGPGSSRAEKVDATTLRKVAFTIFKRRAADAHRQRARRWAMESLETDAEAVADPSGANYEKAALLRRMMQVCIAELANASREDRALLAIATGFGGHDAGAADARSRQRLHRLRQQLAIAIRRELGEEAANLLREDWGGT